MGRVALFASTLFASLALSLTAGVAPSQAQGEAGNQPTPDWTGPKLIDPMWAIFTPADGVVLVQTASGLWRSDDNGLAFGSVPLPPHGVIVQVDPTNANVLFATGDEILYRSSDRGVSWQTVLRQSDYRYFHVLEVAVSPADHNIVYAALSYYGEFRFLGSTDGGTTWSVLKQTLASCSWNGAVLQGHPTDPTRVFSDASCRAGGDFGGYVEQSRDGGRTFSDFWPPESAPANATELGYPERLVGGGGSQPQRWYLAVNADVRLGGGSTLLRSDDDGATWTDVLEYRSGSTSDTSPGTGDLWNVRIEGLAYDPSHPDTIYVARTATPLTAAWWSPSRVITSGVAVTTDAGLTWNDLGSQEVGRIDDLAISNQGTRLFLAANHSLFTLDLGS